MKACIISCGDELVTGQCVDTNSPWLSWRLLHLGVRVGRHITVGDSVEDTADAISQAIWLAPLVILTGGLGPTLDDVVREGIAAAFNVPLVEDAAALGQIQRFFERWQRVMPESNRRQALIPKGARMLSNPCGTAPGIHMEYGDGHLFSLPGVPPEMKAMFEQHLAPFLSSRQGADRILTARLQCFGLSEARLGEVLADFMQRKRNPTVGVTASHAVLSIRITSSGPEPQARAALEGDLTEIRRRLGDIVFGEEDDTLQTVVGRLLLEHRQTVSVAESCTGGLVAKCLTDVPGSSAYFSRGYITYSNSAKIELLGVPQEMLDRFGAVSEQCAHAMADGCRRRAGADFAIAVTGIAGPTGSTPGKPVGLVFIGLAWAGGVEVSRHMVGEHLSREEVRDRACKIALNLLRLRLLRG